MTARIFFWRNRDPRNLGRVARFAVRAAPVVGHSLVVGLVAIALGATIAHLAA